MALGQEPLILRPRENEKADEAQPSAREIVATALLREAEERLRQDHRLHHGIWRSRLEHRQAMRRQRLRGLVRFFELLAFWIGVAVLGAALMLLAASIA